MKWVIGCLIQKRSEGENKMKFGDTNFIGVANAAKYNSFVDEDE
jgi:hypothetical protein